MTGKNPSTFGKIKNADTKIHPDLEILTCDSLKYNLLNGIRILKYLQGKGYFVLWTWMLMALDRHR